MILYKSKEHWICSKNEDYKINDDGWLDVRLELDTVVRINKQAMITDEWLEQFSPEYNIRRDEKGSPMCDRCNTRLENVYGVYSSAYGYKIVGEQCLGILTTRAEVQVSTLNSLLDGLSGIEDREWTKGVDYKGRSFLQNEFSNSKHKLRVFRGGTHIQVGVKRLGVRFFDYCKDVYVNKSLGEAKKMAYVLYKGLTTKNDVAKETIRNFYDQMLSRSG